METSHSEPPKLPSERKFGLLFAGVALVLAVMGHFKLWSSGAQVAWLLTAVIFSALALLAPTVLAPLNRSWFALGLLMGKVVSPLVLGLMFFLLITPMAIAGRMLGRDELRLKKRQINSYWVDRTDGASAGDSFKNQF